MDSSDEFECTQILQDVTHGNPQDRFERENQKVACITINGANFPVFNGDTFIGRDPKRCTIVLDRKSVSSHHALIEVESGHHIICDLGSSNLTRLNGMILKPHIRYNLTNNADVQFADLKGLYQIESTNVSDSSSDDIFSTPAVPLTSDMTTGRHTTLNFSDDDSIIGSTPVRPQFKHPQPRTVTIPALNASNSVSHPNANCESVSLNQEHAPGGTNIYEEDTQLSESETSLFNDSLNSSNCKIAMSSFVVPCTQEESASSSIQLHYETDQSINNSSVDCAKEATEAVPTSDLIKNIHDMEDDECDASELSDVEQKFIKEEMERIERSMSSDLGLNSGSKQFIIEGPILTTPLSNPIAKVSSNTKNHEETKLSTAAGLPSDMNSSKIDDKNKNEEELSEQTSASKTHQNMNNKGIRSRIHDSLNPNGNHDDEADGDGKTASSNKCSTLSLGNIHEAATQIAHSVASDSETDDEGVYGACTEMPQDKENIHDAKTQISPSLAEQHNERPDGESTSESSRECDTKSLDNIHEAVTQIVDAVASDSETDDEGVYGACTEMPGVKNNIHDAKTQIFNVCAKNDIEDPDIDSKGALSSKRGTQTLGNIHEAATQIVDSVASDSEADDEGVYGACTEMPQETENIHDAKTQMLPLPAEEHNERPGGESTSESSRKCDMKSFGNIHEAVTQIVESLASDSETDDEGVYGACTEMPKDKENIHDAKTQMLPLPAEEQDERPDGEGTSESSRKCDIKSLDNIHEAATQIVDSVASDSETDDEGVYGACTEMPQEKENIHDAKTQMLPLPAEEQDERPDGEGTSESSRKCDMKSLDNIHEAATQIVDSVASDSETDDEGVYGACTEMPQEKENIHDAKTQMLPLPAEEQDERQDSEGTSESSRKCDMKSLDNIHEAATQIVDSVASDSETDDEGVYGACTEMPKDKENIHDAKTQMLPLPAEEQDERPDGEGTSESSRKCDIKSLDNIHEAATQIVDSVASDSETDDEGVYGACTEMPQEKENIHDAKTQMLPLPAEEQDERPDGEGTSESSRKCDMKSLDNIHEAATQIVDSVASDSETDDEGVYGACTEMPKDKENIHDAKTQMLPLPAEEHDERPGGESTSESSRKCDMKSFGNIHEAATQIVDSVASDSETDDEGVYGACTEMPKDKENIHDAKTQMLPLPAEDHDERPDGESTSESSRNCDVKSVGNIHEAVTQIVDSVASDSETDDEGVYKACTEMPQVKDIIHDAETQLLDISVRNDAVEPFCDKKVVLSSKCDMQSLGNIHEASTQSVEAVALDSETVNEEVHGGCTGMPSGKGNVNDPKSQVLDVSSGIGGEVPGNLLSRGTATVSNTDDMPEVIAAVTVPAQNENTVSFATVAAAEELKVQKCDSDANTASLKTSELLASQKKYFSVRKRLSLSRIKKEVNQSLPVVSDSNIVAGTLEKSPSSAVGEDTKESVDFCSAATQNLPCPGEMVNVRTEQEEDIFTAATQILPSPVSKPISLVEEDIFTASTQILDSPGCSSVTEKAVNKHSCSPSGGKIDVAAISVNGRMGTYMSAKQSNIVCQGKAETPSTSCFNTTEEQHGQTKSNHDYSNSLNCNTRKTHSKTPSHKCKKMKLLGSTPPEAFIEDTSSDSATSLDQHIEDDNDDNDGSLDTKKPFALFPERVSEPKKESNVSSSAIQEAISPIFSRNSGRRTLSLSHSRSNVHVQESSTKEKSTDLKLSDSETVTQQVACGVIPLMTAGSENVSFKNACDQAKEKKLTRRSARNTQDIEINHAKDASSDDCTSVELPKTNEKTKSILKVKQEAGPSRKSVCFEASEEVTSTEKLVERGKFTSRKSRCEKHTDKIPSQITEDKEKSDNRPLSEADITKKSKDVSSVKEEFFSRKSGSESSGVSKEFVSAEHTEPKVKRTMRGRKHHTESEVIEHTEINNLSGDIAKTKPCQQTSKQMAERNSATGESSHLNETHTHIEIKRSLRGRKQPDEPKNTERTDLDNQSGYFAKPKPTRQTSKRIAGNNSANEELSDPSSQAHTQSEKTRPKRGRKQPAEHEKKEQADVNKKSVDFAKPKSAKQTPKQTTERNPATEKSSPCSETLSQIEIKRSVRERQQPDEPKNIGQLEDQHSMQFAKPKPTTRNSKQKAENTTTSKELSQPFSQTSNSCQDSNSSGCSSRTSTRIRTRKISESSEDELPAKRPSKSKKGTNSVESSLISSTESLSPLPNTEHQAGTRKSSRTRKLPAKLSDNTTVSLLVNEQDTVQAHTSTSTRSGKGCQKNTENVEDITKQPVLENSSANLDLDRSLSISSLKREGDLEENDDLLESKRPKLRRNSAVSTSISPRRSPRPHLVSFIWSINYCQKTFQG
ncbi:Mediator of DNA damage checkpoint protein 1 [Frankliniella fusca]|uniref:Mediator of DNA damage checkpoint protein 1 n=1 Tax=Frankliniella fusca TaxID=407009 RepID=A0AAE1HEE0_9NEOP|nr:Mediator of DNA damage checkpoint protein 1 [Frankliniella fusca]